jgi:TIGR03009 family protein
MRWNVWMILALALATWLAPVDWALGQQSGGAAAQAPTPADQAAAGKARTAPPRTNIDPDGRKMQKLLELWAQQSTKLKSLDIQIDRTDDSGPAWGKDKYKGWAKFRSPNQACLVFQKVITDPKTNKETLEENERIICTGKEVWQYKNEEKKIFVYRLGLQERKRALQEGPLPFLFNFRAVDAKKRYRMTLISMDAKSYVIAVDPLLQVDQECFSRAFIRLDAKFLLPTRVLLYDPTGKSKKDFNLTSIKPNAAVQDAYFKGVNPGRPWKIFVNEEGDAQLGNAKPPTARQGAPRPSLLGRNRAAQPR